MAVPFHAPISSEYPLSASSVTMSSFYPVGNSHSNWGEAVSHGGLDSCFLEIGDAEPFPYAFWPLRYLILKNVSTDLLPIFESSCLGFGFLCILVIKHLLDGFSPFPPAVSLLCCFLYIFRCFLLPAVLGSYRNAYWNSFSAHLLFLTFLSWLLHLTPLWIRSNIFLVESLCFLCVGIMLSVHCNPENSSVFSSSSSVFFRSYP